MLICYQRALNSLEGDRLAQTPSLAFGIWANVAIRRYYPQMPKPIEEMVAVLWEAMLRHIETRIEERIEAALANILRERARAAEPIRADEPIHRDRSAEYFITLKEVSVMVGLSRSTIYSLEKAGMFPRKIHVSQHAVRYKIGEIREWMKSLEGTGARLGDDFPLINVRDKSPLRSLSVASRHRYFFDPGPLRRGSHTVVRITAELILLSLLWFSLRHKL